MNICGYSFVLVFFGGKIQRGVCDVLKLNWNEGCNVNKVSKNQIPLFSICDKFSPSPTPDHQSFETFQN